MNSVSLQSSFPATVQAGVPRHGKTPEGWTRAPLGRYLREVRRPVKMGDEEEYRLVTVKRARGGVVEREVLRGKEISVKSQFLIEVGDFLISKRQIVHGACGLVPEGLAGSIVSNEYAVLNSTAEIDLEFLNYLAYSVFFQQTCFHSSIGVHVEKMIFKLDRWLNWEFDLPPLSEQRKIAEILSTWDRAIKTAEALLATASTQKRTLMQTLLTGKRRFPEFERQEWREVRLGDVLQKLKDGTHFSPSSKTGPRKYITSKNVRNGYLDLTDVAHISEEDHQTIFRSSPVKPGDVLLTKDGANTGNAALNSISEEFSLLSSVAILDGKKGVLDNFFLLQFLLSPIGQQMIKDEMAGQAITRLTLKKISHFRLSLPSLEEQTAISNLLLCADEQINIFREQVEKLRKEKKSLLQQLLTGKWRVQV